jgi:heat-inducible transcriptional repressor
MRILPSDEHQARKEKILQAVVHLYIKTGKPVGSSTIVENYRLNLSPATIRNVLADLEAEEFLTHPHTSAGRVPTDRGYRTYVDSIVNIQRLAVEEEREIREEYLRRRQEIEDLMLSTTRVLSALSKCAGFVLPPTLESEKLRRIELIPINENQVLGVMVSHTGFVRNQMIDLPHVPDEETLHSASRFLNERLSGLSFSEAQTRLLSELEYFQRQQHTEREFILSLSKYLFGADLRKDVYMDGTSNVLKFPEFRDYESMRNFAQLVDEKEALGEVLMKGLNQQGIQVRIGSEYTPELKDFSVVSSTYQLNGRQVGILGILGPKRMQYERMMAIVDTVAKLMNGFLEGRQHLLKDEGSDEPTV